MLGEDVQRKKIFVIVGMPRSGTSAIAKALNVLGVPLGDHLTGPDPIWNPKGFFEDQDIVYQINRAVLYQLNEIWDSISMIAPRRFVEADLAPIKAKAIALLKQRMQSVPHWGFKDPRASKLIPFWQAVFSELDLEAQYVMALRNPLSSACSYQKLRQFDIETGLLFWLMHWVPALQATLGQCRGIVSYDEMMDRPLLQLKRMQKQLDLWGADESALNDYADHFLDPAHQHYRYNLDDLKKHPAASVVPLSVKLYELLQAVSSGQIEFESTVFQSAFEDIQKELAAVYPLYCYLDTALKKNKYYEKKMHALKKSWFWQCSFPLRSVLHALRLHRQKRKAKRKFMAPLGQ